MSHELFTQAARHIGDLEVSRFLERVAESLADCGLDPNSKAFAALYKMISDDVWWLVENAIVKESVGVGPTQR